MSENDQETKAASVEAALTALGKKLAAMSPEERDALFAERRKLPPPPQEELERRLRPFKTPITERTMRRSVRSR